jgi:predicted ATPase
LLHSLLGDDAGLEPLTQRLIERTQGNPFFLEESVRTLVESQVLVREREAYGLAQARPTIHVPATVQAVLAARIDRLPAEEKQLLQTAAVLICRKRATHASKPSISGSPCARRSSRLATWSVS